MTENGKRNLRERRGRKSYNSDVNLLLSRTRILILMETSAAGAIRYYLLYPGYE